MGKYQRFEEIPVWQEAARLYQHVLDVVEEPNLPLSATFKNQLERASLTVSNAVAEGFEARGSDLVALLGTVDEPVSALGTEHSNDRTGEAVVDDLTLFAAAIEIEGVAVVANLERLLDTVTALVAPTGAR